MPEIFTLKNGKLKFYFYSDDHKPIHIHVKYGKNEKEAKIRIDDLKILSTKGFSRKDLKLVVHMVDERKDYIKEVWNEFFK